MKQTDDDPRKSLIKRIQASRTTLPPLRDDATWRDFLSVNCDGVTSLRVMDASALHGVIDALDKAGAGRPKTGNPRATSGGYKSRFAGQAPYPKARALWITLARAGKVGDRSDAALDAFIVGRVGQDLGRLTNKQWDIVIAGLTDWVGRQPRAGG